MEYYLALKRNELSSCEKTWRNLNASVQFSSVQLFSRVWLFATPWSAAHQASLSIANFQSFLFNTERESLVQFGCSVMFDSLRPHGLQHTRLPCSSPTLGSCSNSCSLNQWCHPTISSSVIPFSSCLQSFPASGFFQMSQFFASGGQSIGVSASASVLPMNIQDWSALGWTGWISLQSKGLARVFSNTTVQKHQFFSAQLSL